MRFSHLSRHVEGLRSWFATERGRTWTRRLRALGLLGVVLFLAFQLAQVGIDQLIASLPEAPWFYLVVAAAWASLPASEILIYRPLWHTPAWSTFVVCARKRAFNDDVVGYSGEALLALWAAERGIEPRAALKTVRDNNILSAGVSLLATLAAVGLAVGLGAVGASASLRLTALAAVPLVLLAGALVLFGRHLFAMPARLAARIALVHAGRLVLSSALLMLAWSIAVPEVPGRVWVTFLATQLLVSRVPFLPGRDFLFVGAGVELANALNVAEAAVAGALLVQVATFKVLNLGALALSALLGPPRHASASLEDSDTSRSSTPT
jgi:hypothetical protein